MLQLSHCSVCQAHRTSATASGGCCRHCQPLEAGCGCARRNDPGFWHFFGWSFLDSTVPNKEQARFRSKALEAFVQVYNSRHPSDWHLSPEAYDRNTPFTAGLDDIRCGDFQIKFEATSNSNFQRWYFLQSEDLRSLLDSSPSVPSVLITHSKPRSG